MSSFLNFDSPITNPPAAPRSFSSVPPGSGDSTGELNAGGKTLCGQFVKLIVTVDEVCGGLIGSGAKVCCKPQGDCHVASHKRKSYEHLEPGAYILVSPSEIVPKPFIPLRTMSQDFKQSLLAKEFTDTKEAIRYFDHYLNLESRATISDLEPLEAKERDVKFSLLAKTPAKRQKIDVTQEFAQFTTTQFDIDESGTPSTRFENMDIEEGMVKEGTSSEKTNALKILLNRIANAVDAEQTFSEVHDTKIEEIFRQLGVPPSDSAPTIWLGLAQNESRVANTAEKVENLEITLNDVMDPSNGNATLATVIQINELKVLITGLNQDLRDRTEMSFKEVGSILGAWGLNLGPVTGGVLQTIGDIVSQVTSNQLSIDRLQKEVSKKLSGSTSGSGLGAGGGVNAKITSVSVGRYSFSHPNDLGAWAQTTLPPGMPFGPFVDVYSFLQRAKSFRDTAASNQLKDMEVRKKLDLSADEGIVLESFKHSLPRLFSGGLSENSMCNTTTWLPGIPNKNRWEDEFGQAGVKVTIQENIEVIRSRLESIIDEKLSSHAEAHGLALQLLSDTISFITALCRFISDTHRRLEMAGFDVSSSWNLVSKLVHRIFGTDCHLKRGLVSEHLNAKEHDVMAAGVLWGTFATHQVMRDYMRHGIENHPSISSEYVRFLVANAGLSKIAALEKKTQAMSDELKEIKRQLVASQKAATTASNKADKALELAKKS